jgi:hypothetical protein
VESGRIESLTLVAAVIGAAVLGSQTMTMGYGAAAVGDIGILLALFAFDGAWTRSGSESVAFAGVSSFCLITPLLFIAYTVLGADVPLAQLAVASPLTTAKTASPWIIFGTWAVATLILFAVDRFRMSSREKVSLGDSGLGAPGPMKPLVVSAAAASYRPAPIRVEPAQSEPVASYVAPAPVVPAPVAIPDFEATTVFATEIQPAVAAPVPPPDVTAIPAGREAVIYLNLVGEGLNVLRTVRAESLGRDYYRIADVMPEGELWEFTPGQVVRCRKKSLSNGKHMVAYEEAPRAQ